MDRYFIGRLASGSALDLEIISFEGAGVVPINRLGGVQVLNI